jgi:hypothetical protein
LFLSRLSTVLKILGYSVWIRCGVFYMEKDVEKCSICGLYGDKSLKARKVVTQHPCLLGAQALLAN